ncbi:MAG: hypothetical protein AAF497_02035 [Planctomycetota bacterium]
MLPQITKPRFRFDLSDVLFLFFTLTIMQHATQGMMDDPGLGWHLRIPDLMAEQGGFVYSEYFSFPSEGNRWITRAWLSDVLMRVAYGWGGLNAVALLTCMVVAATLRGIYRRMVDEGYHLLVAIGAVIVAVMGLVPSFVARPNIVSFLGVWLVADLCQRFHAGRLEPRKLFWIVPVMLLWTNMHGGFMAGLVLIAIAWAVEAGMAFLSWKKPVRAAARTRLGWLTAVGAVAGLATLLNPNGIGLHLYNLQAVTDPFIQNNTTIEWRPPDFRQAGWFNIERLILLLPLLAATCRRRINLTGLAMTVAWLHFALTSRRYTTLWVVIAMPTLCELVVYNPWLQRFVKWLQATVSPEMKKLLTGPSRPTSQGSTVTSPVSASWVLAVVMLLLAAFLPDVTRHNPSQMPAQSLDRFLTLHEGEPTFHWANWGGYLTWKGWDASPRFKTWIDDRIEVHGKQQTLDYFTIIGANDGWRQKLDEYGIEMVCIPKTTRLADLLGECDGWEHCFTDEYISVFRAKNNRAGDGIARR